LCPATAQPLSPKLAKSLSSGFGETNHLQFSEKSRVQQTPVEKQPGTFRTGNQFEKPNLAQQISDSRLGSNA